MLIVTKKTSNIAIQVKANKVNMTTKRKVKCNKKKFAKPPCVKLSSKSSFKQETSGSICVNRNSNNSNNELNSYYEYEVNRLNRENTNCILM